MQSYMKSLIKLMIATSALLFFSASVSAESEERSEVEQQLFCLAEAIYFESRGETFVGMVGVGQVIFQRMESSSYPNDICSVVHQGEYHPNGVPVRNKCEFSYWCDGKLEKVDNSFALNESYSAAELVLSGGKVEGLEKALHYHASYVRPPWSRKLKRLKIIGLHIFYSKERIKEND